MSTWIALLPKVLPIVTAAVLLLVAGHAIWRSAARHDWRSPLTWAQPVAALLFYLLLFPPLRATQSDALTVLTPGITAEQLARLPSDQHVVALPSSVHTPTIESTPDLAAALRRHPGVCQLTIVGEGLSARDREAIPKGVAIHFDAAPAHGLTAINAPDQVLLGTLWQLSGSTVLPDRGGAPQKGVSPTRVELLDLAGAVVDEAEVDKQGQFQLSAVARVAGQMNYRVHLSNAQHATLDEASVPLQVLPGQPLKILMRAGAPGPELKYWSRWAQDAGLQLSSKTTLSDKIVLRASTTEAAATSTNTNAAADPTAVDDTLSAAILDKTDLLIVDDRAWQALAPGEKLAIRAAVEQGMGLLLRASLAPEPTVLGEWRSFGFPVGILNSADGNAPSQELMPVTLGQRLGTKRKDTFSAAPINITAPDSAALKTLLNADSGQPLAWWHPTGEGRIGLWTVVDTYTLVLTGEGARYGTLWSGVVSTLARTQASTPRPQTRPPAWAGQREVLCDLGNGATISGPDAESTPLLVDPRSCAAWWPSAAGWFNVKSASTSAAGDWAAGDWIYVRAADDGATLRSNAEREKLRQLADASNSVPHGASPLAKAAGTEPLHWPRWPFFVTWMVLIGWVWWRERR